MEGSAPDSVGTSASWLRCYRCWSQNLEVQLHYEGILKVDAETGEAVEPVEEVQEAVVQCLDCLHDQPHLSLSFYEEDGRRISRVEAVEDRWERMVTGTPWVASCTVTVDADQVESCSGPEAADALAFAAPEAGRGSSSAPNEQPMGASSTAAAIMTTWKDPRRSPWGRSRAGCAATAAGLRTSRCSSTTRGS